MFGRLSFSLIVLLAPVQSAVGATYYVRITGNDGNSGLSPAQAWRTIGKAVNTVVAGDTVYVGAGTYAGSIKMKTSGTAASPIRFVADTAGTFTGDAGAVTIRDDKDVVQIDDEDHIHLIGFRITGGNKGVKIKKATGILLQDCEIDGHSNRAIEVDESQVQISGCNIHDNPKIGLLAKKGANVTLSSSLVRASGQEAIKVEDKDTSLDASLCEVHQSGKRGVQIDQGSVQIVNCLITQSAEAGIGLKTNDASLILWHSTIANNGLHGVEQEKGTSTITNSILAANGGSGLALDKGSMTHSYNLLFGNTAGNYSGTTASTGELSADPAFVGAGNYRLQLGSPAMDSATVGSSVTAVDLDVSPRPSGGGWDMGAYEYLVNIDHFVVNHDGTGIHCLGETIVVTAIGFDGNPVQHYTGTITLDTQSGRGTWASALTNNGVFSDTISDDGLASYVFADADDGVALFTLDYREGTAVIDVDAFQSDAPAIRDDDTEGPLAWAPSGFTLTASALSNPPPNPIVDPIANQIAGSPLALHIAAYGTIPTDPECGIIESYTGAKNVRFWSTYSDPSSGTVSVTVDGSPVAASEASAGLQSVAFSNGQAAVTAKYKDVGRIRISLKDDTGPEPPGGIRGGTNLFVVKPADFTITAVERIDGSPNPGAIVPGGAVFVAAGDPFRAIVKVRDSEGDLTPNYGNESTPEGLRITASTLVAPAGGRNGSNDDGAIGNGSAFAPSGPSGTFSGASFSWDEVGAIRLRVGVADGDYLGAGDVVGSESGDVGRFTPSDFDVAIDTAPVFATACAAGGFTYQGQPFGYGQAPVLLVTARAAAGTPTRNYTGAWWKVTNASLTGRTYSSDPAAPATLDGTGLPPTATDPVIVDLGNGTGTLTFDAGAGLRFDRGTAVGPFDAELSLAINVLDEDSVAYAANPFQIGDATPGNGIAFSSSKAMRYGRLVGDNAYGSELVGLPVPLRAEYWNGSGFTLNADDGCSAPDATHLVLSPSPPALPTSPSVANTPLLLGDAGLGFSAPGAGNVGYVDFEVDLSTATGAGLPWLQYDWPTDGNSDGNPDDNPVARATFGIYAGQRPVIFRREVY